MSHKIRASKIRYLKSIAFSQGYTIQSLADKLGIERSQLSRFFSGGHNPTFDFLLRVCKELNIEIEFKEK